MMQLFPDGGLHNLAICSHGGKCHGGINDAAFQQRHQKTSLDRQIVAVLRIRFQFDLLNNAIVFRIVRPPHHSAFPEDADALRACTDIHLKRAALVVFHIPDQTCEGVADGNLSQRLVVAAAGIRTRKTDSMFRYMIHTPKYAVRRITLTDTFVTPTPFT